MGEVAVQIAKWTLKGAFFVAVILSFIVVVSVITNYLIVGFNMGVLTDIFALLQLWLPFNLNVLLAWISVVVTAYLAYRLIVMGYNMINAWIGK